MTTHELGINDDGKVVDSSTTRNQIEAVKELECRIQQEDGSKVSWDDLDDPDEPRTLFQALLADRRRRVDEDTLMANRPPFCVVTEDDGAAIRLEYYEGHDALSMTYDVRAPDLEGEDLSPSYDGW